MARREIRKRYGWAPQWWRRAAQMTYMSLATYPLLMGRFAKYALGISPPLDHASQIVIRGGINRIRLFDYATGSVVVMLKEGLPPRLITDELRLRASVRQFVPHVPEVLESDVKQRFFVERILKGQVVGQLGDRSLREHCMALALHSLGKLSQDTIQSVPSEQFLADRLKHIYGYLDSYSLLDIQTHKVLRALVSELDKRIASYIATGHDTVETAVSHGDPSDGNVIWDGEQVWWVDWEFAGRRLWLYDYLVASCRTRRQVGMGIRLMNWIFRPHLLPAWASKTAHFWQIPQEQRHRQFLLLLFLLEEIYYYLYVDDNPLLIAPNHAFRYLPAEVETILQAIEAQ